MDLQFLDLNKFLFFVLLTLRIGAIFFTIPFFDSRSLPSQAKVLLAVLLSIGIYPGLPKSQVIFPESSFAIALLISGELLIGLTIGFVSQIFLMAIYFGGEVISQQMGLSLASIFNPDLNNNNTIITDLYHKLFIVILFSSYVHHIFIISIYESFNIIPVSDLSISSNIGLALISFLGKSCILAIKLVVPMIGILVLVTIGVGILARLVPQLNIFIISFPLNIGVGILMLCMMLFLFLERSQSIFRELENSIFTILHLLSQ